MKKIPKNSKIIPPKNYKAKKYSRHSKDPCRGCSDCCRYVAIPFENPTRMDDFDEVLWFLLHKNTWVYVDHDKDWHVQFNSPCKKLDTDGRCTYYTKRPHTCRDYEPEHCTHYNEEPAERILLKTEEDLWEFLYHQRPKLYQKMVVKYHRHRKD